MNKLIKFFGSKWFWLSLLISSWLIIISVIGNYVTNFLNGLLQNSIIVFIFLIVLLLAIIVAIYLKKKEFKFYAITRENDAEPGKFKGLILPISTSKKELLDKIKDATEIAASGLNNQNNIEKLEEILSRKDFEHWNWAVPLKMIINNKKSYGKTEGGRLKHIRLIGTKDEGGSFGQLEILKTIIHTFFDDMEIECEEISDFENFSGLTELFDKIEKKIKVEYNYKDEEIAIDITGGQKPISIVGTFFTLKSRTPILYLSQKDGKIKEINAVINIEPPE